MLYGPSEKTLKKSLHTVLDNALEYVADICFEFPEAKVWAHRGKYFYFYFFLFGQALFLIT